MKYLFSVLVILIAFLSCETVIKDNSDQFKTGVFEIPSGKGFVKETIIRKDSIQISKYGNQIDTLSIKWKNNFFYTLRYINPKTDLQKDQCLFKLIRSRKTATILQ